MLDWSYQNGIGFSEFCVWCGNDASALNDYKTLGFPQIVANLQAYYPPTTIPVVGAPAVSAQNANGLDLFVRGADAAIYWKHSPDGTTWPLASVDLGGYATADPAATSPAPGVIDVFIRGGGGALWEKTTTNGGANWSAWTSLGGTLASGTGPAACSSGSTSQRLRNRRRRRPLV